MRLTTALLSALFAGSLLAGSMLLAACGDGPGGGVVTAEDDGRVFRWKLVTSWPPNLPVNHDGVVKFAKDVEIMSRGRLKIQVFAGGELVPPLQAFDAVSSGTVEMAHSASYYWAGKMPAAQFFTTVPFGMTAQEMWAWLYGENGLEIWRELYRKFDLVPFPMGNTGVQMGGWFKKRIDTVDDLNGLQMRIPGLGGKVIAKAGGKPVLLSAAEVYTALERGKIDATEWVGPMHDLRLGLDRAAQYYYFPGWHEPGTQLELIVHRKAWESLPPDLQLIVENAAAAASLYMLGRMEVENAKAYRKLKGSGPTEVLGFPPEVLAELARLTDVAMQDEAAKDADFRKVYEQYKAFRDLYDDWGEVSEYAYRRFVDGRRR